MKNQDEELVPLKMNLQRALKIENLIKREEMLLLNHLIKFKIKLKMNILN